MQLVTIKHNSNNENRAPADVSKSYSEIDTCSKIEYSNRTVSAQSMSPSL